MPHYSDEQAHAIFNQDMSEVWPYYRDLAERQRPTVERAIENLTGQAPAGDTGTGTLPDTAADDGDELEDLPPEISAEDPSEGALPGDPAPEA
jgi:hypothetical protein